MMPDKNTPNDRDTLIAAFLSHSDWAKATRKPLAGDASSRRYERLVDTTTGARAILMDAPPDLCARVSAFANIASYLLKAGLSAPEIFAQDDKAGLLLLEDLGDGLFAKLAPTDPVLEMALYENAVDALTAIHQLQPPENLSPYDPSDAVNKTDPAFEWYRAALVVDADTDAQAQFKDHLTRKLKHVQKPFNVLALRDFHSENLLWLPDREGVKKVGLLDFQDAILCHPAYDLVSLLEDARRDVPPDLAKSMIARFVAAANIDRSEFDFSYSLVGVQRNLRIIGVLARLALRDGKLSYLNFIPRVWRYLCGDLAHPELAKLKLVFERSFPEPTPERLKLLKEKCRHTQNH